MQINVENIPADRIVYMRRTGAYGEQNYKLMRDMKDWLRRQNLWDTGGTLYAIAQDNAAVTPPEQCRYDICFVTGLTFGDSEIHQGVLPAGAYLVFTVPHTAQEALRFWSCVGSAAANAGRQIDASRPILERYRFDLVEKGLCEFCIPILT